MHLRYLGHRKRSPTISLTSDHRRAADVPAGPRGCLGGLASAVGGQGGSYEFRDGVPVDSIYGYSTGGTTVTVFDGSDA